MEELTIENPLQGELEKFHTMILKVKNEVHKVVVGQQELTNLLLVALFSDGHILLEGVPGIAKTITAKLFSKSISADFSRIQFTPDLMPSDVIGTSVFNMKTSEFYFKKGPVFSNLVLIDEINRSPAKTQAALFEVMEERQITVDGETYPMGFPFVVIATQNPVEQEGTYKLPEAQLDRFIFRIKLDYPSLEEEKLLLKRFRESQLNSLLEEVRPVISPEDITWGRGLIDRIHIKDELLDYIADIIHNTRNNGDLYLGASPRASLAIMRASKAFAAVRGREFVIPEDIQEVCYPTLNHRMILSPDREMEGVEIEDVIREIIEKIEVPR